MTRKRPGAYLCLLCLYLSVMLTAVAEVGTTPVTWFVDPTYEGDGVGTETNPFSTLAAALAVAGQGDSIQVVGEALGRPVPETPVFTTALWLKAGGGAVRIGVAEVPNLVGMTQQDASAALYGAGLTMGAVSQASSDAIQEGRVAEQDPAAGTEIAPAAAVNLALSAGPAPTVVSDLVGLTQAQAEAALNAAGLMLGNVSFVVNDIVPSGEVLSQTVQPGVEVAAGSAVGVAVARYVYIPEVRDLTESEAVSVLEGAGLSVTLVVDRLNVEVPEGLAIETDPPSWSAVAPSSEVTLYIGLAFVTETFMLPGEVPLEMAWMPGGAYRMGRSAGEQDSYDTEDPAHTVTIPGFWIGRYEVTKRQWLALMGTDPWTGQYDVSGDLDTPAVYVSWDDAQTFLAALSSHTGLAMRLPSESEWEYACRAGTTTRFYWGDDPDYTLIDDYAWHDGNADAQGFSHALPVGTRLPNAFGLFDMSGNVYEWCQDGYYDDYTDAPKDGSARPRASTDKFVTRGGAWDFLPEVSRSAARSNSPDWMNFATIGFRVAH